MPLDAEFLSTLKDKTNIAEVVQDYVPLERKGGRLWGCCPFHSEKTPSFSVNEAEGFYHCFGCGASGDVIKFVSEAENVDFMDAVRILAERAKMPMPQADYDPSRTADAKRRQDTLKKITRDTARFYFDNLSSGNATAHTDYVLKRGIPPEIVRKFGLGASLNYGDLPRHLLSKGYSRRDIIDSGVASETDDGKLIDAQGGRLVFPIINSMGDVVAFGGRSLKGDGAKYKNTRETPLFNKGKTLYNINLIRKSYRKERYSSVILVEGYMDTVSLYKAGFRNVVASMGTSLTRDQARLIKRYAGSVYASYDGDAAGQNATIRGLELFQEEGLDVKVVPLPEGDDPDGVVTKYGTGGYQRCLDAALPLIDFKLATLERSYDLAKPGDRRKYVSEALKVVRTSESAAEQEELLRRISEKAHITTESLRRDLGSGQAREPRQRAGTEPADGEEDTQLLRVSRDVIAGYLFNDGLMNGDAWDVTYAHPAHRMIAEFLRAKSLMGEKANVSELFDLFEEGTPEYLEFMRILDSTKDQDRFASPGEMGRYYADCLRRLEIRRLEKERDALVSDVAGVGDKDERDAKLTKIDALIKRMKSK